VKIRDLLFKNSILLDLQGTDRNEVLTQMAHYMCSIYNLPDKDQIARKILDREAEVSTGIGFGIAIPHGRVDKVDRVYMVAAQSLAGIDFNAIDEQPVHLIFMIISPSNNSSEHTLVLSSLSRIMSYEGIRKKLLAAAKPEEFLDLLIKGEDKYVE